MKYWCIVVAVLALFACRIAHAQESELICPDGQGVWLTNDGSRMCVPCAFENKDLEFYPQAKGCVIDEQGVLWNIDSHVQFMNELLRLQQENEVVTGNLTLVVESYKEMSKASEELDRRLEECAAELSAAGPQKEPFSWTSLGFGIIIGAGAATALYFAVGRE